ncbi:MAG: DUF7676 family protein [Chloroflexaceae bacterium]
MATTKPRIVVEPGVGTLEIFPFEPTEQITIFLPNPFYSSAMQRLDVPDWSRLALWDKLRRQYLGLEPDPKDRSATRFEHGQGDFWICGSSAARPDAMHASPPSLPTLAARTRLVCVDLKERNRP